MYFRLEKVLAPAHLFSNPIPTYAGRDYSFTKIITFHFCAPTQQQYLSSVTQSRVHGTDIRPGSTPSEHTLGLQGLVALNTVHGKYGPQNRAALLIIYCIDSCPIPLPLTDQHAYFLQDLVNLTPDGRHMILRHETRGKGRSLLI
ncbi:hypothetical protein An07g00490 [Aspergillus niger]|uniref:Uncharacterized protein n=2 Tax=Aspergillus niger TaxID=5061 RepID=A2QM19_ASPNC|nr:hypothetical protein An07g00490 [Aspergillus niger]CAK39273.1 hypothetical protein An07g00490 [Aspergillus niger]